jgi:hypothetical protein
MLGLPKPAKPGDRMEERIRSMAFSAELARRWLVYAKFIVPE